MVSAAADIVMSLVHPDVAGRQPRLALNAAHLLRALSSMRSRLVPTISRSDRHPPHEEEKDRTGSIVAEKGKRRKGLGGMTRAHKFTARPDLSGCLLYARALPVLGNLSLYIYIMLYMPTKDYMSCVTRSFQLLLLNAHKLRAGWPEAVTKVVYEALGAALLVPWTGLTVHEQGWEARSEQYLARVAGITMPFVALCSQAGFADPSACLQPDALAIVRTTARVLTAVAAAVKGLTKLAREIVAKAVGEAAAVALSILRLYLSHAGTSGVGCCVSSNE